MYVSLALQSMLKGKEVKEALKQYAAQQTKELNNELIREKVEAVSREQKLKRTKENNDKLIDEIIKQANDIKPYAIFVKNLIIGEDRKDLQEKLIEAEKQDQFYKELDKKRSIAKALKDLQPEHKNYLTEKKDLEANAFLYFLQYKENKMSTESENHIKLWKETMRGYSIKSEKENISPRLEKIKIVLQWYQTIIEGTQKYLKNLQKQESLNLLTAFKDKFPVDPQKLPKADETFAENFLKYNLNANLEVKQDVKIFNIYEVNEEQKPQQNILMKKEGQQTTNDQKDLPLDQVKTPTKETIEKQPATENHDGSLTPKQQTEQEAPTNQKVNAAIEEPKEEKQNLNNQINILQQQPNPLPGIPLQNNQQPQNDTEIDQLQKEIAALRTVNDELSKQITTLSAQNHQLKGDKERLNKQTENLAAEKDEAQKEITALRAQNERLMQNEDMGLQDLFDEEKAQLQGQIADLQNMNKQLTEANKDLQAEKTKLETQVKNLTSGKEKAIDGLKNDRNARVNDLNATIADLEHQVKTKAAEIARLQKENNDLRIEKVGNTEKTKQLIGGHIADVITNQLTEQHEANVSSLNLTYLSDIKRKDDEIRDLKEENTDMKYQMELHGIKYVGRGSSTVVREDEEAKDTRQQLEVTVKHQSEVIMRNEAELKKNAETIKKLEIIVNKYRNELDEIKNKNESEDDKNLLDMIEEKQKMMESLQKELEDKETLQNKKQEELDAREKQLNQREKGISSKNGRNSRLMLQKLKSMPHKNNVESSNKDVETQVATAA